MDKSNFNAHAHCFTIDHVPEEFFDILIGGKRFLRISKIRRSALLRFLIRLGTGFFVRWIIRIFSPNTAQQLGRLHGLIKYSLKPDQETLIKSLDGFYTNEYRLVLLTMDMDFMEAGKPAKDFIKQLQELKLLKKTPKYNSKIFPFVFVDPRRSDVLSIVKEYMLDNVAPFQGLKIYPALGYYPFDKKLKEVYEFAIQNEIPVMTHCIDGPVFYRKKLWEEDPVNFSVHPVSGQSTTPSSKYKDQAEFQFNLTHPLNFECLLNKDIASQLFGEPVDFSNLKICLGHFGGNEEWGLHKKQLKTKQRNTKRAALFAKDPLDVNQKWLGDINERLSWFNIIQALMRKYKNVYADISFTLHEPDIFPVLKELIKDPDIGDRILFGTDYYVVASVAEEPALIQTLKKHLDQDEIRKISYNNVLNYLTNKINPVLS
jgi:predicted TIM-barrel fold metal-dependent hydrolase